MIASDPEELERLQRYVDNYPWEITDPSEHLNYFAAVAVLARAKAARRAASEEGTP